MTVRYITPQNSTHTPLPNLGNPFLAAGLCMFWFILLGVWAANGSWDLALSDLFFNADLCAATTSSAGFCRGFPAALDPTLRIIRSVLQDAPKWIAVILLLWILADRRVGFRLDNASLRSRIALIATLIIWPLIIVNGILKAYWGRPRPWQTQDFGGPFPFVEAGTISDYCASNCSFVSGEASSAGWLTLLYVLFPRRFRVACALILFTIGVSMAGLRVAFGAHYVSDVSLGFLGAIATFAVVTALLDHRYANA